WKVPIDGGDPVRLTEKTARFADISPDGKRIVYFDEQPNLPSKLAVIPFEGGLPTKRFDVRSDLYSVVDIHWSPDGQALMWIQIRDGVSNIWSQPVDGGPPRQLTDFKSDQSLALPGHAMANSSHLWEPLRTAMSC
ncbi:MAG TPA: hypothetical protein VLG74_13265, partial [Blastocatellia bacterium]|nr:hypothetical protein [Blastocatellia bacterium]